MRLLAAGQRPISNVVDAQQLRDARARQADPHLRRRRGPRRPDHRPPAPRRASGSRRSTTSMRDLDPETLLIADPAGPIGIAGVMGGADSEVTDATTDVVVESAIFDPVSIRRTAFRYALRSEASLRFEKGQEFRLARLGADRTARLIAEWAGGTVAPGRRRHRTRSSRRPRRVAFRPARVNRLLGTTLDDRRSSARCSPASASRPQPAAAGHADPRRRRARGRSTSTPATTTRRRRDRADLAARPRGRGRRHRGGRPRPRLRARPVDPAAHADAAVPARPARAPRRRPRDARRRRPDRGRDATPSSRRGTSSGSRPSTTAPLDWRAGPAGRRPADRRHQPAVEPALGPAPAARRQPARRRVDQPAPRPRRRRRSSRSARATARRAIRRRTSGGGSGSR